MCKNGACCILYADRRYRLRVIRMCRGLRIIDVAEKIGVSAASLSKYEREPETVPANVAKKLSHEYRVPIDDINFS